MKTNGFLFPTALIAIVSLSSGCNSDTDTAVPPPSNLPTATMPAEMTPLEDFDQRKFGMFIHWGIYAVAGGEFKGQKMRGISEWIQNRMKIPVAEYAELARGFDASQYDPEAWAQLAEDAGMRYMVITAKHHDGFAMYDSEASAYDVVQTTPYASDPMPPLAEAARSRDMLFGFYYSQDQDWAEPDARGNDWEFDSKQRQSERYMNAKVLPQIDELTSNYGDLGLIWFDTPGSLSKAQASALRDRVKERQPDILLNSRIGYNLGDYSQTSDNGIPLQVRSEVKWEVPATINHSWGYKKDDHHWREPRDLIAKLVDIVSKGGNYLLNVGPRGDGVIPPASQAILREIGDWLSVNGDAIYATDACPFYYRGIDWRCTTKANKLYIHLLSWPDGPFSLPGLASQVSAARLLDRGHSIAFKQVAGQLELALPETARSPHVNVIELDIKEVSTRVDPGFGTDTRPDSVDLYAWSARFRGADIRYDWDTSAATGFVDISTLGFDSSDQRNYKNELWWYPYGTLDGHYSATITYACNGASAGTARLEAKRNSADDDGVKEISLLEMPLHCDGDELVTRKFPKILTVDSKSTNTITFAVKEPNEGLPTLRVQKVTLGKNN